MRSLKVLVVDDEQGIRDLLRDALARHGHTVVCAENGVEAVARAASADPDVVFLDIRMPKGDGLTALKEIRSLKPSVPVVLITGCSRREFTGEAFDLGSSLCLVKPFSTRDVIGALDVLVLEDKAA